MTVPCVPVSAADEHRSVLTAMMGDVAQEDRSTAPLVGRDAELAELADRVGLGDAPGSASVVLGGDAGVGKTRLLAELGARARAQGWRVLVGHCLDFGDSALPLLPLTEVLGRLDEDARAVLEPVVAHHPAVARLLPAGRVLTTAEPGERGEALEGMASLRTGPGMGEVAPLAGRDDAGDGAVRGELFEGLHTALEVLGGDRPVLLVVEDVHWADRSTRDLLSFFFARGFATPVSVVVSYRADDLHRRHPLRSTVAEWGRMPSLVRLHLAPLGDADVRTLVRSAGGARADQEGVEEIVRRAEGNAFFAEELLAAHGTGGAALPWTLADVLLVRLDRLPEETRAVVRAAACVGRRVPHAMLEAVVDLPAARLDEALRAAVEANILVPTSDAGYSFRHALLGEAVYDDLLPGERARLHAACARALREGGVPGAAAELARHARAGHDPVTAVRASVEAGEEAMRLGGPEEAAGHFLTALELLGAPAVAEESGVARAPTVRKAADALITAGHAPKALDLLLLEVGEVRGADAAAEVAPASAQVAPAAAERAELLVALAFAALMVDTTTVDALAATEEALGLLGEQPSRQRVRALAVHAQTNADRGRFEVATRAAQAAHDLAVELGLERLQTEAATTLGRLKSFVGEPEAARTALEDVVAGLRRAGDTTGLVRGLHQLGGILFEQGRYEEAHDCYREAWELARDHGRRWAPYGFDARALAAICAYQLGDWDEVDRLADTSTESAPPVLAGLLHALRLHTMAGRGDPGATAALAAVPETTYRDGWAVILTTGPAIDVLGDTGDLAGSVAAYDRASASVTALWQVKSFPAQVRLGALLLAHLADRAADAAGPERAELVATGDRLVEAADVVARRGEEIGRVQGPEGVAWTARHRAEQLRLRWRAGVRSPSLEELVTAWEESVETFGRLGSPFERARSQARLASVLAQAGPEQAARVHQLVAAAREVAERLGALPLLAELARVEGREVPRGGPGRSAPHARADPAAVRVELTRREREVLGLVTAGRSNGEIGRQLFITTKTASVHVSNILAKLGVSSRTEAAAVARERGLLG
ncbi:helix-turn-helix transcriptional regulator [Ornithinimicrobium avium]|uniref:Helix-turn-helix transcriptional regulator n=1 Tax=Ornithinimicrobium avium TaxID=2283195 RepID=A0A345NPM9_9MICO|nr:helix-turn-helix transcriptional regulator [Ornithinimicrobium avium]AXH96987.1 helix-turn-helix transcriptional regulator [Ornithinimicrobium avium]